MFQKPSKIMEVSVAIALIACGFILRLLPHSPNFAPIGAIAIFSGVYLSSRKLALLVPVLAMILSDIFLGFYEPTVAVAVYGCFIFSIFLGFLVSKAKKWYNVLGASLLGSVVFFVVTNFAVWAFAPWYAKTAAGLWQCYLLAVPFFRNTLLGDLFYAGLFFGSYEVILLGFKLRARQLATIKIKN